MRVFEVSTLLYHHGSCKSIVCTRYQTNPQLPRRTFAFVTFPVRGNNCLRLRNSNHLDEVFFLNSCTGKKHTL
jgi:hypothetical protein